GSPTASSNLMTISSTTAARHGTSSSTSPGGSCPSDCANGRTGFDQRDLVLLGPSGRSGLALQSRFEGSFASECFTTLPFAFAALVRETAAIRLPCPGKRCRNQMDVVIR